jgi:putative membrane protein
MSPGLIFAHVGCALHPHDLWTAWHAEPFVVGPLAAASICYVRGLKMHGNRDMSSSGASVTTGFDRQAFLARLGTLSGRRSLYFVVAMIVTVIALCSPVDAAGSVLFSAHMIQHELLMVVAAPLFVLARPVASLVRGLPASWRIPLALAVVRPYRFLSRPAFAWVLHAAALWIWHLPPLFDLSVRNNTVHAFQHASFFLTALIFWESVLVSRRKVGVGLLSLFTTMLHMGALAGILALAGTPWYPVYAPTTIRWGLTPLEDQQIGGLIMWIPAGLVYVIAALGMMVPVLRSSPGIKAGRRVIEGAG